MNSAVAEAVGEVGVIRHPRAPGSLETAARGIGGWEIHRADGGEPVYGPLE